MKLARKPLRRILMVFAVANLIVSVAHGTEKSGSVWPVGAESIAIALAQPGLTRPDSFITNEDGLFVCRSQDFLSFMGASGALRLSSAVFFVPLGIEVTLSAAQAIYSCI